MTATIQSQIDATKQVLDNLIAQQNRCNHSWGPVVAGSCIVKEWYDTGRYETHGIHMAPIGACRDVRTPEWKRTCLHCGKVERTVKQQVKEVSTVYEPQF